tara:strand:+ start:331 stop:438 length:108 start_codon:yes stop_codon:yes gene_type:complete
VKRGEGRMREEEIVEAEKSVIVKKRGPQNPTWMRG